MAALDAFDSATWPGGILLVDVDRDVLAERLIPELRRRLLGGAASSARSGDVA